MLFGRWQQRCGLLLSILRQLYLPLRGLGRLVGSLSVSVDGQYLRIRITLERHDL